MHPTVASSIGARKYCNRPKREGNSGIKKVVVIEETQKAWQNLPDGPFQARLVTTPPPNALVELEIAPFGFTPLAYPVSVAEADEATA